jgi:exoribonuclease II
VLAAKHNDILNAKRELIKSLTADRSDLINKVDESYNKYMAAEKTNKRMYNENVNNYLYGVYKNQAYNEYQHAQLEAGDIADEKAGITLNTIIEGFIANAGHAEIQASEGDVQAI